MTTGAPPVLGNPRRLLRVLESVAGGVRRPASIARVLDIEGRVIRSYLTHAEWLGLVKNAAEPHLTRAGLDFVYAGNRRAIALAVAVRAHPVLGAGPTVERVAEVLVDDGLAASIGGGRRDARAIFRLIEPARKLRPKLVSTEQLHLGFAGPIGARRSQIEPNPGDDSLDVYALVLRSLLENGELRLNTLRGVLDDAGAGGAGLGGYVALAVRRGDAERRGDVLVVTPGALARADLAESVVSVGLSDPDFRAWLDAPDRPGPEARRCARWARRLFGSESPERALPRLLFGRSMGTVPAAGEAGGSLPTYKGAFLDVLMEPGLALAFPGSLERLGGGIAWVHSQWRAVVQNPAAVRIPGSLDARVCVHAGLLPPGEPPPRNIPDLLTLRLRAARSVPAFALLTAAGILHRRKALRLRQRGDSLFVERPGRPELPWNALVGRLARARGWHLCPVDSAGRWRRLLETAEGLGLVARIPGEAWTIDETLFWRLGTDPEHHELHDRLGPLADLLEAACENP
ncbi:hypothetical protein LBMAG42_11520 [Deltaproteobacteria bacterium]|nr:hypothetical protein LBMAG42_11520 [Deltaproteobacteria bacterium]